MISHYFREQERYTKYDIEKALHLDEDEVNSLLKKLKEFGVVKTTRGDKIDLSDLQDDTEEIVDVETSGNQVFYVFNFVGVITLKGIILKIYPKYITDKENVTKDFKQVVNVLKEYNKRKSIVRIYNESEEGHSFNLLAVMLYLMQDYWKNGLYTNSDVVVESNGSGEILWERTISDSFAYIQRNKAYYLELFTQKRKVDDFDYFQRLHECVLTEISDELKNTKNLEDNDDLSLLELFELEEINISDEKRSDFGDDEYIIYRIDKELNAQFNTRKQNLLKILYTYISHKRRFSVADCLSLYGTTGYHKVWEDVCSSILNNQLQKPIKEILTEKIPGQFNESGNKKLIELIDKPYWDFVEDSVNGYSSETLEPDLISVIDSDSHKFIIFDAKYYSPTIEKQSKLKNIPGIGDITKQYLYELAYKDFIDRNNLRPVSNCFLIPTAKENVENKGHVSLPFLKKQGLQDIQIRLLPTHLAYDLYIAGKQLDINILELDNCESV